MTPNCVVSIKHPETIYGYRVASNDHFMLQDLGELYRRATRHEEGGVRRPKKLVVFGGLHGHEGSEPLVGDGLCNNCAVHVDPACLCGYPFGQGMLEKANWSIKDEEGAHKAVGTAINFTYVSLERYCPDDAMMSAKKRKEVEQLIKRYAESGDWVVYLAMCWGINWMNRAGL